MSAAASFRRQLLPSNLAASGSALATWLLPVPGGPRSSASSLASMNLRVRARALRAGAGARCRSSRSSSALCVRSGLRAQSADRGAASGAGRARPARAMRRLRQNPFHDCLRRARAPAGLRSCRTGAVSVVRVRAFELNDRHCHRYPPQGECESGFPGVGGDVNARHFERVILRLAK